MKRFFSSALICILLISNAFSQSGKYAFSFLDNPYAAHTAALGGINAALATDGINGAMANPALLTEETDNQLAIDYTNYLYDTNSGSVAYGKTIKGNLLGVSMQYLSYGDFEGKDEYNQSTGDFSAKDMALNLLYAKQLDKHWQAGVNFKPLFSAYESYSSFGLAADIGFAYINKEKNLYGGLVFANIGQQITAFYDEIKPLPFNVVFSISKKFEHAPIRINFTAHHLNVWDLNYYDNITTTTLTGEEETTEISKIDMLFRHTIFGIDLVPSKNIYGSISYNHRRMRELDLADVKTWSGVSFGGGLKLKAFDFSFAACQYQKGIWTYHFSLMTNLNAFKF